ncbi:MAG: NAD(P)H-dependent oxidoreductase [Flavobacteriales bacterium]|nr:NAD(P)H-dependent oxidoreductase [Flavobacteriales bacterium]
MSKKILAYGASNSRKSINKKFANYAAHQVPDTEVKLLDLNDFEMPLYSIDREEADGMNPLAIQFRQEMADCDGIVISFAEHNGAYTAAFKNIFEWISRAGKNIWSNKPMLLLATAPGEMGGRFVPEIASNKLRRMNTNTIVDFSLPSFGENFDENSGITNPELKAKFDQVLNEFIESIEA